MNQRTIKSHVKVHSGLSRQVVVSADVPGKWVMEGLLDQGSAWWERLAWVGMWSGRRKMDLLHWTWKLQGYFLKTVTSGSMSLEDNEKKGWEGTDSNHVRAKKAGKQLVFDFERNFTKWRHRPSARSCLPSHMHHWDAEPRCPGQSITNRTKISVGISFGCCPSDPEGVCAKPTPFP